MRTRTNTVKLVKLIYFDFSNPKKKTTKCLHVVGEWWICAAVNVNRIDGNTKEALIWRLFLFLSFAVIVCKLYVSSFADTTPYTNDGINR